MYAYIVRRLLISIPLLLGATFLAFMLLQLAPGDMLAAFRQDPLVSEETLHRFEEKFHLDKNPVEQYVIWVWNVVRGDFGESFTQKQPVVAVIRGRAFNTILLSLVAMLFTWLVALPLGIMAAVRQNKVSDRIIAFISFFGMSIPGFFFCLLLLYVVSLTGILPVGGMTSPDFDDMSIAGKVLDVAVHLIIPTIVLGMGGMAGLQRIMRGNMLEVLRAQYITTARAKGLSERRVVYWHALRNAINPMITLFGFQLSALLSGAAFVEIVCGWPGLGSLMLKAMRAQDQFLVMGSLLIGAGMLIMGNLLADIALALSDPRISYR